MRAGIVGFGKRNGGIAGENCGRFSKERLTMAAASPIIGSNHIARYDRCSVFLMGITITLLSLVVRIICDA